MKKPFAVGDRVAVYATSSGTGIITNVLSDTQCTVKVDEKPNQYITYSAVFHVKQLRRLVKRKPAREWWINGEVLAKGKIVECAWEGMAYLSTYPQPGWTKVREVRPKK